VNGQYLDIFDFVIGNRIGYESIDRQYLLRSEATLPRVTASSEVMMGASTTNTHVLAVPEILIGNVGDASGTKLQF
jgi:hypothetical protein